MEDEMKEKKLKDRGFRCLLTHNRNKTKRKRILLVAMIAMLLTNLGACAGCSGCNVSVDVPGITLAPTATTAPTKEVEPTVAPTKEVAPTPTTEVTPTEIPSITEEVIPTEIPTVTEEPTEITPTEAVVMPTETPVITEVAEPTTEPTPTEEPTVTEVPVVEPTTVPTMEPTKTPIPTKEPTPTVAPTNTPKPIPTNTPTPKPKPTVTPTPTPEVVNGISAGDYILFGNYPKDVLTEEEWTDEIVNATYDEYDRAVINGKTYHMSYGEGFFRGIFYSEFVPIEWEVWDIKDGKALVISKNLVDVARYANEVAKDASYDMYWEISNLRAWLNDYFYNRAFSEEEKASILTTKVESAPSYNSRHNPGPDTYDKVYVPSVEEVKKYYGEFWTISTDENEIYWCYPWKDKPEQTTQLGHATEYTIARNDAAVKIRPESKHWVDSYEEWILRNRGEFMDFCAYVLNSGYIAEDGGWINCPNGIRPCMWIDLKTADVVKVN